MRGGEPPKAGKSLRRTSIVAPIMARHAPVGAGASLTRTGSEAGVPRSSPPTVQGALPGLHDPELDRLEECREDQRIGEDRRHIEELKGGVELETDPIRTADQLDDEHDFPDQGQARA